jgi:hypothetical protein
VPRTIGISPKVALPGALTLLAGVVLLVLALATGDDTLRAVALTVLAAAGVHVGVGAAAPPGAVVHDHPEAASDDLLDPEVSDRLAATPPPPG